MEFFNCLTADFNLEETHLDMIFSKYQWHMPTSNRLKVDMQLGF